jgi:RND superfamily putative drug exporter
MAKQLQKLGELMFRLKWWVVLAWVIILTILAIVTINIGPKTSTQLSIPGTQAQKALDKFDELFPGTGAASAKVVLQAPEGKKISDFRSQIETLSTDIAKVNEVTSTVGPFALSSAISKDGTIGFITVQLNPEQDGMVAPETLSKVNDLIVAARAGDLTVVAGGDLVDKQLGEIAGPGEASGIILALIILVITLGSLIAAGMPLVTAFVAVGVSMAGLFSLSHVIEVNSTAPVLAVMLGLAVGIDYSLFIVNRYRTYIKEGYGLQEAAGRSIATAGNAVVFAASTVVIALVSLAIVQIPFMTIMGAAAAGTVAVAAIVALTLIPALFGIFGLFIFGRRSRRAIRKAQASGAIHEEKVSHGTFWYRWGEFLLRFRKTILISALAIIVVLAWPITSLRLGLPTDETAAPGTSQRQAYDLLADGFGVGYNGPLLVVVEGLPAVTEADKDIVRQQLVQQYQAQLQAQGGAAAMAAMNPQAQAAAAAALEKNVEQYAPYYQLQLLAGKIGDVKGVEQAQAILTTDNGMKGAIQVTPSSGPSDQATQNLVAYLRDTKHQEALTGGTSVTLGVTGTTALQIDINAKLSEALPIYLGVVVGLSFLILMLAFRSILIPVKATLGFLLSVFAMFGALVAVFQWGWFGITDAPGPIVSFIPIIAIGILFGLAMDYEFFLVSGMQEAFHKTKKPKEAVLEGFAIGSRVVVAAGLIMISVFAGFIGNHDSTIKSMGFALALGILIDAFIVRMTIVPIVMSYLGKAAWWIPKWLDKILPRISIEGDAEPAKKTRSK